LHAGPTLTAPHGAAICTQTGKHWFRLIVERSCFTNSCRRRTLPLSITDIYCYRCIRAELVTISYDVEFTACTCVYALYIKQFSVSQLDLDKIICMILDRGIATGWTCPSTFDRSYSPNWCRASTVRFIITRFYQLHSTLNRGRHVNLHSAFRLGGHHVRHRPTF